MKVAYRVELRLLYNTIAIAYLRQALARQTTDKVSHMFVAEEAQQLVPKILRKLVVTDTWTTTEFATRLRKGGESLVIISQSPSNIEDDIRRNAQNNFYFRLQSPEDIKAVTGTLGFTWYDKVDYFTQVIANLKQREAVVKTPLVDEPFIITASEVALMKSEVRMKEKVSRVRINTIIKGEPANWLSEWKRRGIVLSNTDAVVQAFRSFNEKITEQDLKSAQLRNIRREED